MAQLECPATLSLCPALAPALASRGKESKSKTKPEDFQLSHCRKICRAKCDAKHFNELPSHETLRPPLDRCRAVCARLCPTQRRPARGHEAGPAGPQAVHGAERDRAQNAPQHGLQADRDRGRIERKCGRILDECGARSAVRRRGSPDHGGARLAEGRGRGAEGQGGRKRGATPPRVARAHHPALGGCGDEAVAPEHH